MEQNILNINLQKQRSENWCYAAIIEAVNNFYGLAPLSQETITKTFGNNSEGMQDPIDFLRKLNIIDTSKGSNGIKFSKAPPTWDDVTKSINEERPLICLVGQHYILLIGYEGKSNRDSNRKYIFLDPLYGSEGGPKEILYSELSDYGFLTNYAHKRVPAYEKFKGIYYTKPPSAAGGKRKTRKGKMHKRKTLKRK